ncbi:MAG: M28 family peptidase [bacterium]|nr:M28 family peptidase [bacterium]
MEELISLMNVLSTSGHESAIRSYLMKKIKPYCKDMQVDKFGNLIVHKKGKGQSVMLVAHMDEVGLMVNKINVDGTLKISPIGGIDTLACLNQKVLIPVNGKKTIMGIISTSKLSSGETITELPKKEDLFVDTGLSKIELQKIGVEVGTFVEFEKRAHYLGSKDYIMGKAADDRVGCFILLELIKKVKKYPGEIYFVFTVQEEVGLYGAKTSVYNLNPEWALVIDVLDANDIGGDMTRALGKGPVLSIMDSQTLSNSCLNNNIKDIAKKKKLGLQPGVSDFGTTDALYISLSKGGIPTTVLGVPVRNVHSGIGIVNSKDILSGITIIDELLKHPPKICL